MTIADNNSSNVIAQVEIALKCSVHLPSEVPECPRNLEVQPQEEAVCKLNNNSRKPAPQQAWSTTSDGAACASKLQQSPKHPMHPYANSLKPRQTAKNRSTLKLRARPRPSCSAPGAAEPSDAPSTKRWPRLMFPPSLPSLRLVFSVVFLTSWFSPQVSWSFNLNPCRCRRRRRRCRRLRRRHDCV